MMKDVILYGLSLKSTKKTNRQIQAEETKQKILDSCAKLLAEQGFDAVKITDICADAGVSVGSVYHHIGNKAGIIANLQQAHVLSDAATAEQIAGEILILSRGTIMNWCQCRGSYDLAERGKRLVEQYLAGYRQD